MIRKINYNQKEIIMIGTAHISKKSIQLVKETIDTEKPDVVGVELDRRRFVSIMNKEHNREMTFKDVFKTNRPGFYFMYYILQKIQKKVANQFDTTPGEEMVQGVLSAKENNAKLFLLDRDAEFTLNKLLKNLKFKEKMKLLFGGREIKKELGKDFNVKDILKNVEEDNSEKLNKILDIFMKKHKTLKRIMIDERDQYMALGIRKLLEKEDVNKIVVVVGAGHLEGMSKEIFNDKINLKKIMSY